MHLEMGNKFQASHGQKEVRDQRGSGLYKEIYTKMFVVYGESCIVQEFNFR